MTTVLQYMQNVSWVDDEGNKYNGSPFQGNPVLQCPGTAIFNGYIFIPDGSTPGTEFDLVLPGLTQGCSFVQVANKTGQELNMAWGGNWAPHLPDQGVICYAFPQVPAAGGILGLRFMLTKQQVGLGKIKYVACGT